MPAEPRFVVACVTGFGLRVGGGAEPTPIWYVYDRAYCYRRVGVFRRGMGHPDPEAEAVARAAQLEREMR